MQPQRFLAGCAALLVLLAAGVQADDDWAYPPPLDGIQTVTWFPGSNGKSFEAGKMAQVVVGLRNNGAIPVNVSAIGGSINSPFDFSFYVQNFTFATYDVEVAPGKDISMEYTIWPSNQLSPREFILCLTVFYKTTTYYTNTVYNATVDITEPQGWIDSQLLFLVLIGVAGVLITLYIIYSYIADTEFFKRSTKRPRAKVEVKKTEHNPDEWLKGTAHDQFTRQKAKRAESAKKAS